MARRSTALLPLSCKRVLERGRVVHASLSHLHPSIHALLLLQYMAWVSAAFYATVTCEFAACCAALLATSQGVSDLFDRDILHGSTCSM